MNFPALPCPEENGFMRLRTKKAALPGSLVIIAPRFSLPCLELLSDGCQNTFVALAKDENQNSNNNQKENIRHGIFFLFF
jgi:hypothetical protein